MGAGKFNSRGLPSYSTVACKVFVYHGVLVLNLNQDDNMITLPFYCSYPVILPNNNDKWTSYGPKTAVSLPQTTLIHSSLSLQLFLSYEKKL